MFKHQYVIGQFPSKQKIVLMIDTGASVSLISDSTIARSNYLRSLVPEKIEPRRISIANGEEIAPNRRLVYQVKLGTEWLTIHALIVPSLGAVPALLGCEDLKPAQAVIDMHRQTLTIGKHRSFKCALARDVNIAKGQDRTVLVKCQVPSVWKQAEVVCVAAKGVKALLPSRALVSLQNGVCELPLHNDSDHRVTLKKGTVLAYIDVQQSLATSTPVCAVSVESDKTTLMTYTADVSQEKDTPCETVREEKLRLYPFLDEDDPRLDRTDEEILREQVNLDSSECILDNREKDQLRQILLNNKSVFSLHGEIGNCPYEVDFRLTNYESFYIRPYSTSEQDKVFIDKELDKLVKMGVLRQGLANNSSPLMLIDKPNQKGAKRLVADLRYLNKRIIKTNYPFPLVRDTIQKLGASECTVISVLDLKDAFHSLKLAPHCQRLCGVSSYFGGRSFYYVRLPMGASISPAVFQNFINKVMDEIPDSRDFLIAHMDDLLIYSKSKEEHMKQIEVILEVLARNGLKISPKKAYLFRKKLVYMGHQLSVEDNRPCISALRTKCEAIQRLQTPKNAKQVRSFIGAVNYLAMYLPKLHTYLRSMYGLTRKRGNFQWTKEHANDFEAIKKLLVAPPVLVMPRAEGKITLHSDTSKIATGASLWQEQDGKDRLIAYHSKSLPAAAARYTITELELTGLYINVLAFKNLLKATHFTAVVDHSALTYMMNSKSQPPTTRLQKLVERLSAFSFDLKYQKGSEMVICDLLSRMCSPLDEDTQIVIPVALPAVTREERPVTRAYAKKLKDAENQEKASLERRTNQVAQNSPVNVDHPQSDPLMLPPSRPPTETPLAWQRHIPRESERITASKPVGETVTSNIPDHMYQPPQALFDQLDTNQILLKRIPRQVEIDKLLKIIQTRCLRDYHLPITMIELKNHQKKSVGFTELYAYMNEGILPANSRRAKTIRHQADGYALVSGILFKIDYTQDQKDCKLTLCVPDTLANRIIAMYHDSLLASHQGITRTYLTIRKRFYIPALYDKITTYIESCQVCQTRKIPQDRDAGVPLEPRIKTNWVPMEEIHCDIKHMFPSTEGFTYLLVCVCAQTRYVVTVPLRRIDALSVAEAIIQRIILTFGVPKRLVMDEGRSFLNSVVDHICKSENRADIH